MQIKMVRIRLFVCSHILISMLTEALVNAKSVPWDKNHQKIALYLKGIKSHCTFGQTDIR